MKTDEDRLHELNLTVEEVVDRVMKQKGIDDNEIRSNLIKEVRSPTSTAEMEFVALSMFSYFERLKNGPPPTYVRINGRWIKNPEFKELK